MTLISFLSFCGQVICGSQNSNDELQDPIAYLNKCMDIASMIHGAIDIEKLEQNKEQNIEYLTALYHCSLGSSSYEEKNLKLFTLKSKKKVLEQYGDEFYARLKNINDAAHDFLLRSYLNDMHFHYIGVLDIVYIAFKVRLSYVRTLLDASNILMEIPNNNAGNQESSDHAENLEQNTPNILKTYQDDIDKILQKWIDLVSCLKKECTRVITICNRMKRTRDFRRIVFDTKIMRKGKIDYYYGYSMSFVEFVATQCLFEDNVERIIPFVLNDNYYKNALIDSIQIPNLESAVLEKTLQKYFSALENSTEKKKYKDKLLAWHQDTKDRYESLHPAIEMCYKLIEVYIEKLPGMNENEKARFIKSMEETIVSMKDTQSRILKFMQHGPDIIKPKVPIQSEESSGSTGFVFFVSAFAIICCVICLVIIYRRKQ